MSTLKITSENFGKEVLNADKPVVVDFYADWCGPCKMMAPIIDELADENGNIKVGKVNVDDSQDLAVNYGIMSIPTIIIFKNGNVYKKFIGVVSKQDILKEI